MENEVKVEQPVNNQQTVSQETVQSEVKEVKPKKKGRGPLYWIIVVAGVAFIVYMSMQIGEKLGRLAELESGSNKEEVESNSNTGTTEPETTKIEVTSLKISNPINKIYLGESSQKVEVSINEDATDKSVTWKSSNDKVVTVDENGNIKPVSLGTATISVTSVSNPNMTDKFEIAVWDFVISATGEESADSYEASVLVEIKNSRATKLDYSINNSKFEMYDNFDTKLSTKGSYNIPSSNSVLFNIINKDSEIGDEVILTITIDGVTKTKRFAVIGNY